MDSPKRLAQGSIQPRNVRIDLRHERQAFRKSERRSPLTELHESTYPEVHRGVGAAQLDGF
jgi:hypothetical protein